MSNYVSVDIDGEIKAETDKAVLLDDGEGWELWCPKSVIDSYVYEDEISSRVKVREPLHSVEVAEWFAEREGLI